MRWAFMILALGAVAILYGVGPEYGLYAAFGVLCANFATFCLKYDEPLNRARRRVAMQLERMRPGGGMHGEEFQRLQSAPIKIIAGDRETQYNLATIINLASGIAAIGLLVWGAVLRIR